MALAGARYLAALVSTVPDPACAAWWRGARPSRRRWVGTAMVAVVFGALAGRAAGWGAALPAFIALALVAAPLAVIDARCHRLPDRLVGVGAMAATGLLGAAAIIGSAGWALARAAASAAMVAVGGLVLVLAAPDSIGFGDVKLAALLASYLGWLGWARVGCGILAGMLCGAGAAVGLLVTRRVSMRTPIAIGPALIAGALAVAAMPY
ncbi:MAG: prepilin peptidase [Actinomycetia bacterium]|nr:prepilin peptidase [Actinomycetes bacterium]